MTSRDHWGMDDKTAVENYNPVDNSVDNSVDPLDVSMSGIELDPQSQENYLNALFELGLDMSPGTGEYRSGEAGIEAFQKGDYFEGGLGILGAIPGLGMVTRGARRLLPSITKLGDEVSNAMHSLKDREDELKALLPKSVPNERGLMTDPMEELAKVNPEKHAELVDVRNRIANMNSASMTDQTVEGTLRAGGFMPDNPAIANMQAQMAGSKIGRELLDQASVNPAIANMQAQMAGSKLGKELLDQSSINPAIANMQAQMAGSKAIRDMQARGDGSRLEDDLLEVLKDIDDSNFAEGGVVSLLDTARNMTRRPRGIMGYVPYLGAK